FATQTLRKEVRSEVQKSSASRVKTVRASIALQPETYGCQSCMEANVGWQWNGSEICRSEGDERVAPEKPWTQEELPSNTTEELREQYLTGLVERQLGL